MKTAVELLREFATFQGNGMRGIVRMKNMQLEAQAIIKRIDQARARAEKRRPVMTPAEETAQALRTWAERMNNKPARGAKKKS